MIYHPIPAASVARALVNLSFRDEPGVFIQQYSELVAAIKRAVKRALDVVISMTTILFLPRLLLSSIAAAPSSPGPRSF
jgi:lipopolysaccharide/colanic/teichoic acid biosynthesis glycosyltransferase